MFRKNFWSGILAYKTTLEKQYFIDSEPKVQVISSKIDQLAAINNSKFNSWATHFNFWKSTYLLKLVKGFYYYTADVGLRCIFVCGARTSATPKWFRTHFRTHLHFWVIAPAPALALALALFFRNFRKNAHLLKAFFFHNFTKFL